MPQDGSNNYYYPPGTPGVPDTTIESAKYNTFLDDLVTNDLNIARPIHRGGTGATTADAALAALGAEKAMQQVTNYDTHDWKSGSFFAYSDATGTPTAGPTYSGICTVVSSNYITVEARNISDASGYYIRQKIGGTWGAWVQHVGSIAAGDARYVNLTGDNMTGLLTSAPSVGNIATASTFTSFQVMGGPTAGDAAFITFHRPSMFAAFFGLDTDNAWKVGGFSHGAVAYKIWHEGNHTPGNYLLLTGGTVTGDLAVLGKISSTDVATQYNAKITARSSGIVGFEFGHGNTAGYASSLGAFGSDGRPYLGFCVGLGTGGGTFKTLGLVGSVIQGDLAGGFVFGKVANANADSQALTTTMTLSSAGTLTLSGGNVIAGNVTASGGDLMAARTATSGYVFFGSSGTRYIHHDGTNFGFTGGTVFAPALNIAGAIDCASLAPYQNVQSVSANLILACPNTGGAVYIRPTGSASSVSEFRYDAAGWAFGNMWSPNHGINGGFKCKVGADNNAGGSNWFNMWYTGGGVNLYIDNTLMGNIAYTSDYRTKKDVLDLPSMWDTVKALRPIKYTSKDFTPPVQMGAQNKAAEDSGEPVAPFYVGNDIEQWGFIAHELQETLIHSAATGEKDDPSAIQSPNPWPIIAALTKTIQELQARIEALESPV